MKKVIYGIVLISLIFISWTSIANNTSAKTTPPVWWNLYANFEQWHYWLRKDYDPLFIMLNSQIWWMWHQASKSIIMDVNWDWLPDIIYWEWNTKYVGSVQTHYQLNALLINKWNFDYEIEYRCLFTGSLIQNPNMNVYWDCAK